MLGIGLIAGFILLPNHQKGLLGKNRRNLLVMAGLLLLAVVSQIWHGLLPAQVGLRFDTFVPAMKILGPIILAASLIFITIGLIRKTAILSKNFLIAFIFYPIWGLFQQYLLFGFFFQKFQAFFGIGLITILLTAIIFASLHWPGKLYMLGSLVGGILFGCIFIKTFNLFAIALCHGWTGAIVYYFSMGKDYLGKMKEANSNGNNNHQ